MARTAGGASELDWARDQVAKARSADELRQAQAILLPLELGLSLADTALAIGRSLSLTCKLRNRRRREQAKEIPTRKRKSALRNRAVSTLEREAALIDEVLVEAASGGVVVIPAFAVGRAQSLLHCIQLLKAQGVIADVPIYLNSPMELSRIIIQIQQLKKIWYI